MDGQIFIPLHVARIAFGINMDPRLKPKSDLHVFVGYVLLLVAVVVNPIALWLWAAQGIVPPVPAHHFHESDIRYLLPSLLALLAGVSGGILVWAPKRLGYYLNNSFRFNLFMFCCLLAIMFSLNVIHPGQFKGLRLLYLLGMLFFLANTLYQAVVKKRDGPELHPFYRNLAVAAFGVTLVLMLLEGGFLFHESTHRFNGTLGSRAWFLNHWTLNEEGYRDAPYDSASVGTRRKVLVIGDSFVAGHGIKDANDRFTNELEALLPGNEFRVYNLGVGGSDTRDENKRLRAFPYKPDILIFSWYPNDIEQDGERGGLLLQHARSYHDIPGFARYFARRSYLWNYLYWRYPHPDELSDYFGYIQQCFSFLKVRYAHFQEIDRLVAYGDSLQVPMAAVVFPFLENAAGSQFATDPVEGRFRGHGVPTLSVRQMLLGKPAIDYIVNQNDPHPNERLHKMVADSLLLILQRANAFSENAVAPRPIAARQPVIKSIVESQETRKPQPKADPKSQPQADSKETTQPQPKADPKSQPKADSKETTQPQPKADPKTQPKADTKKTTQPQPKVDPKSQPKADSKKTPQPQPKADPKSQPKADSKEATKPQPKADPKTQPKADSKKTPQPQPKADPKLQPKPAPAAQVKPVAKPKATKGEDIPADWQGAHPLKDE